MLHHPIIRLFGIAEFDELTWHKKPKEKMLKATGLHVEYGEPGKIEEGKMRGSYLTVSDEEHIKIILLAHDGLGMVKIGEELGRSSATPHNQVKLHNKSIVLSGYCQKCKRAGGPHAETKIG